MQTPIQTMYITNKTGNGREYILLPVDRLTYEAIQSGRIDIVPTECSPTYYQLTDREQEIMNHIQQGRLYKEIADALGIASDTVRKHCHNIYEKLGVGNRMEAVQKFFYNQ